MERGATLVVPVGALAQAWRGGPKTPLRTLIDDPVVRVARRSGGQVATSDADDLRRLDPRLDVVSV